jgi:hypothetical protein
MAKQPPRKKTPARKPAAAPPPPAIAAGNGIVLAAAAAPATTIAVELGIDNLVAVGVVHAEARLAERLATQVDEANRLGVEVQARIAALHAIYDATPVDPAFLADCEALVAAAAKLGLHLAFELVKGSFSAETLKYTISVRFRGDLSLSRGYQVADAQATALVAEVAGLRDQQAVQTRGARATKDRLSPGRLEKLMRAGIAENAMRTTEAGSQTLEAWFAYIDRAVDGPVVRALGME